MSLHFEDDWDRSDKPPKHGGSASQAIHPGEAVQNMKEDVLSLPKLLLGWILCPATYLVLALFVGIPLVYYTSFALLFDYLPARAFGYTKGTQQLDTGLWILLSIIGGLVIWVKVNRAREKKRLADKVDALRQRNRELQANLARVIDQKGRNHPETAYAHRELGENWKQLGDYQEAEKAHRAELEVSRETLGAKSPEVARASRSLAGLIFAHDRSQEKSSLLWEAEKIEKGYR
ncbi:MAG: tetratricopeptide repeat protein [Verrucomicrobia bacterium]|nr:tetratricopeptide repeat protein [Verrucomicrobiota bacterium]